MTNFEPTKSQTEVELISDISDGQILGGRYRVLSLLGEGGMGVVYKVEQIFLGKTLALKTILKDDQDDFILRRFEAEAKAVFSVNHPNIIAVHDFGLLDDKTPFMAMEFIDGKTLGQRLKEQLLSVDEAIPLFIQICLGLAHAHESGVVHRDIKPNNLMIVNNLPWGTEGSVKILDFGIAKLAQHEGGEIQALTRTGEIFGSPFYMSPEQCLGGKIDRRSDIYSLGCVFFEALTGTPPFVADNALNTMMMHQRSQTPTLKEASLGREFPPALEKMVQRLLAKNPDERYQNLGIAALDLADLKRGAPLTGGSVVNVSRPASPRGPAPDMVTLEKNHFALTVALTAFICAVTTALVMQVTHKTAHYKPVPEFSDRLVPIPSTLSIQIEDEILTPIKKRAAKFGPERYPTDKLLENFRDYTEAQFVSFANSKVTEAGLKYLRKSKLLQMDLTGDTGITSVDEIANQSHLQKLNLSKTGITDSAIPKLAKMPMLEQLDISDCNISEKALSGLTASTSLARVQLSDNKYSKEFIGKLQTQLPQCVFRSYFASSLLDDLTRPKPQEQSVLQEKAFTRDSAQIKMQHEEQYKKDERAFSLVSKANPLCRQAAHYLVQMAGDASNAGHPELSRALEHRAEKISEETKDELQLRIALFQEAKHVKQVGPKQDVVPLLDHTLKLYVDNTMHDERNLVETIWEMSDMAIQVDQPRKAIEYCQLGEKFVDQFPGRTSDFVANFCERIASSYISLNEAILGLPAAYRNLNDWEKNKDRDRMPYTDDGNVNNNSIPKFEYARALIESGQCELDRERKKYLFKEALKRLDDFNHPEDLDLNEHYCDACREMANIYDAESNPTEALTYLKRALVVVNQMKHKDTFNRKKLFTDLIASHATSTNR